MVLSLNWMQWLMGNLKKNCLTFLVNCLKMKARWKIWTHLTWGRILVNYCSYKRESNKDKLNKRNIGIWLKNAQPFWKFRKSFNDFFKCVGFKSYGVWHGSNLMVSGISKRPLCLHKQEKKITFNIEFTIPLKLKHQ